MTIKQALALMKQGKELTITRKVTSSIGTIALTVSTFYAVGNESITGEQFATIKKRNKLVKNMDKSSSAICVYRLSSF